MGLGDGNQPLREIRIHTIRTPKVSQLRGDGGDYQERESVADTSDPSEDTITTLTPHVRTTR